MIIALVSAPKILLWKKPDLLGTIWSFPTVLECNINVATLSMHNWAVEKHGLYQ
jgi:hypothetical protein